VRITILYFFVVSKEVGTKIFNSAGRFLKIAALSSFVQVDSSTVISSFSSQGAK